MFMLKFITTLTTMRTRFVIRKSRLNKSGTCPVNCRITINMVRSNEFSIGLMVDPSKWDSKGQRVKGNSFATIEANRKIEIVKAELSDIYLSNRAKGGKLSAEELRSIYLGTEVLGCRLSRLSQSYLNELRVKGRSKSTMVRYERCFRYLQDFLREDMDASSITRKHVSGFWLWLRAKNYHTDYCNKIVQSCIGLFRYGVREGHVDDNPFSGYSLEWKKELDVTCLEKNEVEAIRSHEWNSRLEKVADAFLFMCYTGLHIADYIGVTANAIYDYAGHKFMKVVRIKTKVEAIFPLTSYAKQLIDKYGGINNLPKISAQKMNDYLKLIAAKLDITKKLTNKIARKTFTNMCINELGLSFEVVATMLGHTTTRQVRHYGAVNEKRLLTEWQGKL